MTNGVSWLVLRVRNTAEAARNVANQGTEFYSPMTLVRSRISHKPVCGPLFPGYAFARPPGSSWVFLRGTRGVRDVLMSSSEHPAWLPDIEIARIRAREVDGLVRLDVADTDTYAVGERVHVDVGDQHLDAIVDGMSGPDRVTVLMHILGRWSRVEVGVGKINRAD